MSNLFFLISVYIITSASFNISIASVFSDQSGDYENVNSPKNELIKRLYSQGNWGKIFELIEDPSVNLNFNIRNNQSFLADIIERKSYKILNQIIRYRYDHINTDIRLSDGASPILHFLHTDQKEYLDFFMNSPSANYKFKDSNGRNIFHHIALQTNKSLSFNYLKTILSKNDSGVNDLTDKGETPFFLALRYKNEKVFDYLLQHREVNINKKTYDGSSALHRIIKNSNITYLKKIVSRSDLDYDIKDLNDVLPAEMAYRMNNIRIFSMLIKKSNLIFQKNDRKGNSFLIQTIIDQRLNYAFEMVFLPQVDINKRNHNGWSVMDHLAYFAEDSRDGYELFQSVLASSPDYRINDLNMNGRSVLMLTCEEEKEGALRTLANHFRVNLNQQNYKGQTALHICVQKGNFAMVQILLKAGASVHLSDSNGLTPYKLAKKLRFKSIKKLIKKYR